MSAHQNYLEAPYVNAAAQEAAFESWAEKNEPELDWDDDKAVEKAWDAFEEFMNDWYDE
jgi:hypothetical protein